MSTELMTATNDSGTISMTGYHRGNKRRYQITITGKGFDHGITITGKDFDHAITITGKGFDHAGYTTGTTRVVSVEVDAETIANMQRCVNHYETPKI